MRVQVLTLVVLALTVTAAGCGGSSLTASRDLKAIGRAYHNWYDATSKGPSKAEDLKGDLAEAPKAYDGLAAGRYVFSYGVGVRDMPEGTATTILAYESAAPSDGGWVLMGDGGVLQMTATEFSAAPKASPRGKTP